MASRVLITGIGVVSPLGCSREQFWEACLTGRSGVRRLETPWVTETGLSSQIAATIEDFDAERRPASSRKQARVTRSCLGCSPWGRRARHSVMPGLRLMPGSNGKGKLRVDGVDPTRLATVIGSGIGGHHLARDLARHLARDSFEDRRSNASRCRC